MRRIATVFATAAFACQPLSASAQGPEQLDQLEPGEGEWEAEYLGLAGSSGIEHALEVMAGLDGKLAIGVEIEGEASGGRVKIESFGPKALYRFTEEGAAVGLGLQVQLGFDGDATLTEVEARLIAEARGEQWWAQGDAMLRRELDKGTRTTRLAYAWSLQRPVGDIAWLGLEGSGQSTPLWSDDTEPTDHGHFLGPSLTFDWEPRRDREVELGLAYFRRFAGGGPKNSGRVFVQLTF